MVESISSSTSSSLKSSLRPLLWYCSWRCFVDDSSMLEGLNLAGTGLMRVLAGFTCVKFYIAAVVPFFIVFLAGAWPWARLPSACLPGGEHQSSRCAGAAEENVAILSLMSPEKGVDTKKNTHLAE